MAEKFSGNELIDRYLASKGMDVLRIRRAPTSEVRQESGYVRMKLLEMFEEDVGLVGLERSAPSRTQIEAWLSRPSIKEPSARYQNWTELNSFYEWAVDEDLIDRNPMHKIDKGELPAGRKYRAISPEDLERAVVVADPLTRAYLLLAARAGCELDEIAHFSQGDVLPAGSQPSLRVSGGRSATRIVPLDDQLRAALDAVTVTDAHTAWETDPSKLSKGIVNFLRGDNLEIHQSVRNLRHRFGYDQASLGKSEGEVAKLMGVSVQTAAKYFQDEEVSDSDLNTSDEDLLEDNERSGRRARSGQVTHIEDPRLRLAIEIHAVDMAIEHYTQLGGTSFAKLGKPYDIRLELNGVERHVEVKGSSLLIDTVELTINEVTHANSYQPTDLLVVDSIHWSASDGEITTSGGRLRVWSEWVPGNDDLRARTFAYSLPTP